MTREAPQQMQSYQLGFELSHILQQHRPIREGIEFLPNREYLETKLTNLCETQGSLLKLPTNPAYTIKYFKVKESIVFKSATKPLYLVCHCVNDRTGKEKDFGLIFKHDDLRKDQIILNLIYLMNELIIQCNELRKLKESSGKKKHKEPFMQPIVYRVLPTGVNYGFIEPVKKSKTLKDVLVEYNRITSFLGSSQTLTYDQASKNFSRSLATWNIITHLLGVGDRHNQNVMFTEEMKIFHIDYGFILGMDPKFFSSVIRNDTAFEDQFLDNEKKKEDFYNLCIRLFLQLRKHHSFFLYQITFLTRLDPKVAGLIDEAYIEDIIGGRFLPGVPKKEATDYLRGMLKNPITSFAISFFDSARDYRDQFLKIQEKTSKSVTDLGYNIFEKIVSATKSVSQQNFTIDPSLDTSPNVINSGSIHNHSVINDEESLSYSLSSSVNSSKFRAESISFTTPQLSNTYPINNQEINNNNNNNQNYYNNDNVDQSPLVASLNRFTFNDNNSN